MFDLLPFKESSDTNKIKIHSIAVKEGDELYVEFRIEDPHHVIFWGDDLKPIRTHELWKSTCFEAFIGIEGSKEYWELNLSSHGAWNFYHFDFYRNTSEPRQEDKVSKISFKKTGEGGEKKLEVRIPIKSLGLQTKTLEISLASVIEFKNKEKSYFAIKHAGDKPDFHKRDSFVCNLE